MINVTITFKNDPSIGLFSESYMMQIPDFWRNWTESMEMLGDYIEEKRREITELYSELQGDNCQVMFQWEEETMIPIKEDTYQEILKEECDEERRTFDQIIHFLPKEKEKYSEERNHRIRTQQGFSQHTLFLSKKDADVYADLLKRNNILYADVTNDNC